MKKLYVAVILSLLCIAFTGCGKKNEEAGKTVEAENETETEKDDDSEVTQDDTESGKNESGDEDAAVSDTEEEADSEETDAPDSEDAENGEQTDEEWLAEMEDYERLFAEERAQRREVYHQVIRDMVVNHVWPDGSEVYYDSDLSQNSFSICDIDGDEKEELLISYWTTYMADQREVIYEYDLDTKELRTQLLEFPYITFYTNGVIWAGHSHNQTNSDFWPFTLYRYEPSEDVYVQVGTVVAWDRDYMPDGFPEDVDWDGDGRVFAISDDDSYPEDFTMDNVKYEVWYHTWIGENVEELEILWMPLEEASLEMYPLYPQYD